MYIKIYNDSGYQSLKNIQFPVIVRANTKRDPIAIEVHISQFETMPGFRPELVEGRDLPIGDPLYSFLDEEYEFY